jgi:phosphoribosyl-dephospho-CoA transferase
VFQRHDLLLIDPGGWADSLARLPPQAGADMLADWARLGRPVILRRRWLSEPEDGLAVGVQLPPAAGGTRVALRVRQGSVVARPPRPDIAAALPHAPPEWRRTLTALLALPDLAAPARVFGSLLWQCVTGLPYVRAQSDLDLTFPCAGDPHPVAASIAAIDRSGHPRIDGELLLPDGAACHWRELTDRDGRDILVKTCHGVELRPRAALAPV